ncbi:DNAJ DOMAIN (PROKARYOTIC HEAT SHOCK PROTEIN)-RELATED [Salix koriyanagi]|uniref:DNAJ DOMAIN (PROKARYOTIC HEAT SHOCK PROTEIN)-RELATED n=1 Tax=Salix koriyanagi TaxID=2511006 RepID=A0A9Q0QLI6_9ROSI|nr:DNAJ DOMAIN (PROKARYOTIC HEAT SHOCK PROTEIN)-RELATED [Salix koriyanagi]
MVNQSPISLYTTKSPVPRLLNILRQHNSSAKQAHFTFQTWPPQPVLHLLAPPHLLLLDQKFPPISLVHHHRLASASALFEYPPPALPPPRDPRHTLQRQHQPSSLYEVLGIQMGATCQEIKTAYRRLARTLHPDVAASGQREDTAYEFMRVHEAYETLSDPEKRADYDRSLYRRGRQTGSPFVMSAATVTTMATGYAAAGFSGYTSQRWETDQCW